MSISQQVLVDKLDKIQSALPYETTLKALDTNTVESYNAIRQLQTMTATLPLEMRSSRSSRVPRATS